MPFVRATKENLNLRLALTGPSGSGKTWTALDIGTHLGQRVALIDTEAHSSCRYAHEFEFDVEHLPDGHPNKFIGAIGEAARGGYDVLIIDSFSHAWLAELDIVGGNFSNWSKVRPLERQLLKTILTFPGHVIATMRSKTEWVLEKTVNKRGQETTAPSKVGLGPVQGRDIDYEFDVVGLLDHNHILTISKTRFKELDGVEVALPGKDFAHQLLDALRTGGPADTSHQQRQELMDQSTALIQELGWDTPTARQFLNEHFGITSRNELSIEQLEAFNQLLQQEFIALEQPSDGCDGKEPPEEQSDEDADPDSDYDTEAESGSPDEDPSIYATF